MFADTRLLSQIELRHTYEDRIYLQGFRVTESALMINLPTYGKTYDIVTFTTIINLSYFKIVNLYRSW